MKLKGGFEGRHDKRELEGLGGRDTGPGPPQCPGPRIKLPRYSEANDGWLELDDEEEEVEKQEKRKLEEKREETIKKMPRHGPSESGQLELANVPVAVAVPTRPALTNGAGAPLGGPATVGPPTVDETMENESEKRRRERSSSPSSPTECAGSPDKVPESLTSSWAEVGRTRLVE